MNAVASPQRPRIVIGVDGSEQSKLALEWAASLAGALGASVDAVAVWQMPSAYGWSIVAADWSPEEDTHKELAAAVDAVFGAHRPKHLRLLTPQGNAAQVLLSFSEGATMLVLGSRGRGGFKALLLGSVSANCAEHAHCPVLVVHGSRPPATSAVSGPIADSATLKSTPASEPADLGHGIG